MRKVREILRLRFEHGLSQRQMSASTGVSKGAIGEYLQRAEAAGVTWDVARGLDDSEVEARLFRHPGRNEPTRRVAIDLPWVHRELRRTGVTLQQLWCEYRDAAAAGPRAGTPYGYSQFCDLYADFRRRADLSMRQVHRAGEKVFIDYSGKKPLIWSAQTGEPPGNQCSFSEKLALLVDREWTDRDNRRLGRLLRAAHLTISDAACENVWCDPARGLDKSVLRDLATCDWIRKKHNVIVIGKTGVGKSYLGAALAQAACRKGMRAFCTRVPRLAHELAIARADGTYTSLLGRLARIDVLVLDDFLIAPLKDTERRDLLEVLEDRYGVSSTIVTSQVPTKNWHEILADPTIADAICDRLVHNAHVVALKGPSGREKKGLQIQSSQPSA